MTLHDHIDAVGNGLWQLDGMPRTDICALADQLAVLADLVAGVADGSDYFIDAVLRAAKRQGRLSPAVRP
jgi:hypothetical protein